MLSEALYDTRSHPMTPRSRSSMTPEFGYNSNNHKYDHEIIAKVW